MQGLTDYIIGAVKNPREKLTRGQHNVRYAWDLAAHCWRQLLRHRAEGMAAELTYRTIFSLIPVVVLSLVMFRVVGGLDDVQQKVENQLFSFFGVPEIGDEYGRQNFVDEQEQVDPSDEQNDAATNVDSDVDVHAVGTNAGTSPESESAETAENESSDEASTDDDLPAIDSDSGEDESITSNSSNHEPSDSEVIQANKEQERIDAAERREEARRETRASIRKTLHEAASKVSSIDFASIGVFGLLLFVYAAVALADSTEYLFNRIYDAPKHRPVHIRLAIHWSIITLGSGLLAMSLYMSGQFVAWAGTVGAGLTSQMVLARILSFAASWVLLFLLYALMPNTHVSPRAAAIGALVGTMLWEGAKFGFQIYVSMAVPYSALYGSLGLIPLFLFWIYVTWLIVLFGLILTYTLQTVRGRRLRRRDDENPVLLHGDPDWMLPIMSEVASAFSEGTTVNHQDLGDQLGLSGRIVFEMATKLVDAGLLRRVSTGAGEEDTLTLAKPAEKITVKDILRLAHQSRPTSNHPAWQTLASLKQAERDAAHDKTLDQLVRQSDLA